MNIDHKQLTFVTIALVGILCCASQAQAQRKYSYAAQKRLIPAGLGSVYLGMPLKALAAKFDLSKAEADGRFEFVQVEMPFDRGNIAMVTIKIGGIKESDKAAFLTTVAVKRRSENGNAEEEYFDEVHRIDASKAPASAFVYEIDIQFTDGFDLKGYARKLYGKPGEVDDPKDEYHFFTMQWAKRTTDGLVWLIRYHEATNVLQLCGRIPGTEWSLD
jgi:hypothetical protein